MKTIAAALLAALALLSVFAGPAEAAKRHRSAALVTMIDCDDRGCRNVARETRPAASRANAGERRAPRGYDSARSLPPSSSTIVDEARRWIGTNPTVRRSLWCAAFMNFVLNRVGVPGTGSDLASSFAFYGTRISGPQVGAIAVMHRQGGGHVGVVTGLDGNGNPIIVSGNSRGRKVAEGVYPRSRIYAYVTP